MMVTPQTVTFPILVNRISKDQTKIVRIYIISIDAHNENLLNVGVWDGTLDAFGTMYDQHNIRSNACVEDAQRKLAEWLYSLTRHAQLDRSCQMHPHKSSQISSCRS